MKETWKTKETNICLSWNSKAIKLEYRYTMNVEVAKTLGDNLLPKSIGGNANL